MNYWNQIPLFRLILPFLFGIITALSFNSEIHIPLAVFIVLITVIAVMIFFFSEIISYRLRWIVGLVIYIAIFLSGFEITVQQIERNHPSPDAVLPQKEELYIARVTEPVTEKKKTNKVIVEIISIKKDSIWLDAEGQSIIYFEKDSCSSQLKYGDYLLLNAAFHETEPPQNPHEFNYKRYLSAKGIYYQSFVKSGRWCVLSHDNGNIIYAVSFSIRDKFLQIFRENNMDGDEFAVASALMLGYRSDMDRELIQEYSNAGVIHILSVSGLHVGIIFFLLNYMLFFLDRFRYGRFLKFSLLMFFIWFYALLTGLSPPVLRASVMISFIIIGDSLNRYKNIYNTLTASAFLLLIIEPYLLTDIGFQLSYLAVVGIVAIHPKLNNLWSPKMWLIRKGWAIITVSIAAQIAAFPLCLFYFYQFPNYFLIANLAAVPLSAFIIYAGVAVLIVSPISWLSNLLAVVLIYLIKALNYCIGFIEQLPYSVTTGISINTVEMILIYSIIISLLVFALLKYNKAFLFTIASAIFLATSVSFKRYSQTYQQKFIVYNINKVSAYDFIDGKQNYLFSTSSLFNDKLKQQLHIQNNWYNLGLIKNSQLDLSDSNILRHPAIYKRNNFIQFKNKTIAIINGKNTDLTGAGKITVDYLIMADNIKFSVADVLHRYNPGQIIIDSSNSFWKSNKWLNECKNLNIKCYAVKLSGAFVKDV